MAPCCHRAQCPQVTHWEGTATAGALGADKSTEPATNPTKAALRDEAPPGEPLQGHQPCWPPPDALPVPSPAARTALSC